MAFSNYISETITSSGATISFDINSTVDTLLLAPDNGAVTLAANIAVNFSGTPYNGQTITVVWTSGFTLDGNTFTINGVSLTDLQALKEGRIEFNRIDTGAVPSWANTYSPDWRTAGTIDATVLKDETVTLAKLVDLTRGSVWVGDATGRPAELDLTTNAQIPIGDGTDLVSVPVTGDIAITNAGVTSIAAGVIVNADINANAAIALSKLAALTASKVAVTDGSGVITTANQVSALLGGNGIDNSAATGFPLWAAGTQTVGSISEVITLLVSFEAAGGTTPSVGDFKVKMPYAGTVTEIYAYAVKAVAGTDNGTIVPKDNGGTTMTAGTVTFTASDARGTAYTTTPSANNTFVAGDLLTFTTAKTTAGGLVQLSITVTRTS